MDQIKIYKEQIKLAEEQKRIAEKRVLTEKHYRYDNLVTIRNFIAELKRSLAWHQERKHHEA